MMKNKPTAELKIVRRLYGYTLKQKWTDGKWYELPIENALEVEEYMNKNSSYEWRGSYVFPANKNE